MAKIKNSGGSRWWWGCGERRTLLHCKWSCTLVQPLWKSVWWFLINLYIVPPEDPSIPLLSIYSINAPTSHKAICSTMFVAFLFIIARNWKEFRCSSTEKWIHKLWFIFTMEYYSAIRNNGFMKSLGKLKELEAIMLSEITQSQKTTHGMWILAHRSQNTYETI